MYTILSYYSVHHSETEPLVELGLNPVTDGENILSIFKMIGLLLGGIPWGVLGDKKRKTKVLFGSILLYSLSQHREWFSLRKLTPICSAAVYCRRWFGRQTRRYYPGK